MGLTGLPKTCLSACQSELSISSLCHKPVSVLSALLPALLSALLSSYCVWNCKSPMLNLAFFGQVFALHQRFFFVFLPPRSIPLSEPTFTEYLCFSSSPRVCLTTQRPNQMSNYPFESQLIAVTFPYISRHFHSTLLSMMFHLQCNNKIHGSCPFFSNSKVEEHWMTWTADGNIDGASLLPQLCRMRWGQYLIVIL